MIILWSGATNNLPSGWVLCDGTNSTPDLRNRFVVGAGDSYAVGATGGSVTANDNVRITVYGTTGNNTATAKTLPDNRFPIVAPSSHSHSFSGTGSDTVSIDTRSPYYALAYIMKT